jgi:ADP-heptose:LPS heptosyltransferase
MTIDRSLVKRILVITLSNVGDIILTTPVIRTLSKEFPSARLDVMVGPNGREIFERDPSVFKLIIYDKHIPISEKRRLQLKLKKLRYDLVVDIRNTVFPLLIGPKFRTATIQKIPKSAMHSKKRHLYRLKSLGIKNMDESSYIHIPEEDLAYIEKLMDAEGIKAPVVVMGPGAKSHLKRWTVEGFAELGDRLVAELASSVVFIGSHDDREIVDNIIGKMKKSAHNLVGRTNIRQLAAILKRSDILITNDSAPLHLGCATGTKVLALFGPTDSEKYGPTGEFDVVISKKLSCSPCEVAVCSHNYECMKLIAPDEVFEAAKVLLEGYE